MTIQQRGTVNLLRGVASRPDLVKLPQHIRESFVDLIAIIDDLDRRVGDMEAMEEALDDEGYQCCCVCGKWRKDVSEADPSDEDTAEICGECRKALIEEATAGTSLLVSDRGKTLEGVAPLATTQNEPSEGTKEEGK